MSWRERHLEAVQELEHAAAEVMLTELDRILDGVQSRFAAVTAANGPDDEVPGEPTASLDDLALIRALWGTAVNTTIGPWFRDVFALGAFGAEEQITDMFEREVPDIEPDLIDEAAVRHLARAEDRLLSVGDETWEKARGELLEGFREGEGIDAMRRRLQGVAELSRAQAEMVARTEVISASNAGAMTRVRLMGDDAPPYKQWLSTLDARTRPTHAAADNQVVERDAKFDVGNASLDVPGDPSGLIEETANCRCTCLFLEDAEPLEALGRQEGGITEEVAPLVAAAQEVAAMPWEVRRGGDDCPYEVIKTEDGERVACHDTEQEAVDHVAALFANEPDAAVDDGCPPGHHMMPDGECMPDDEMMAALSGEHFHAVMHTQGVSTGMRTFNDLTWRTPPFAFHWQRSSSAHGGMPETVQVGLVDRVVPAGDVLHAWGHLDLDGEVGREFARQLVAGFARWVSIGLDEQPFDMEIVWPEDVDDDPMGELFAEPEQVIMTGGRIGELTAVSMPAQDDATVEPTAELVGLMRPDEEDEPMEAVTAAADCGCDEPGTSAADAVQAITAAAYRIEIPDLPPAWWFEEPTDVEVTRALSITEEGRIYGALAPLGVNHRAFAGSGRRQEVPSGNVDYDRFMGGVALTSAGPVAAGPITMDCGHAPRLRADHDVAPEHYDNTCSVVGKIRVGESKALGVVWAAGALEPGVSVDEVSRMLACRLSGDWQPHSDKPGWTELVAALLVPSPGFPMPARASAEVSDGVLVASSVPVRPAESAGRPRLRVDVGARRVERVASATPRERIRRVIAQVRGA